MKNLIKASLLFSFLALAFVVFNSCEKEDDYDYSKIVPKVLGLSGPAEVAAHGLSEFPYTYDVTYFRGGSKLTWTVTTLSGQGQAVVTTFSEGTFENKRARIVFPQRSVGDEATITIVETTQGGVESQPFTYKVKLNPFCYYDVSTLAGNYSGTSWRHGDVVKMETTANLNELRVYNLANFVVDPDGWDENWIKGDGSCLLEVSCGDVVTIKKQWIGESDYPDDYSISGSGTIDMATKTINLTYIVHYTGGQTPAINTVLTMN